MTINALKAVCALSDQDHLDNLSNLNLSVQYDPAMSKLGNSIFEYQDISGNMFDNKLRRQQSSDHKFTPRTTNNGSILK